MGIEMNAVAVSEATLAYTEFLLATAALGTVAETCAAMTPCLRLYAHLGSTLAARSGPAGNPNWQWIETYADPGFEALAGRLEGLLDRYDSGACTVRSAYRRAMRLELAFFDAAYRQS